MWKWRTVNEMTTGHGRGSLMVRPNGKVEEVITGNLPLTLRPQETVIIVETLIATGRTGIGSVIGIETENGNEIEKEIGDTTATAPDQALPRPLQMSTDGIDFPLRIIGTEAPALENETIAMTLGMTLASTVFVPDQEIGRIAARTITITTLLEIETGIGTGNGTETETVDGTEIAITGTHHLSHLRH
jgi:hypothetical protein